MKKLLLAVIVGFGLFVGAGFAQATTVPLDWYVSLRDGSNDFDRISTSTPPSNGRWNLLGARPDKEAQFVEFDSNSGITIDSGVLRLQDIPESVMTGLVSDLATLTSGLAGKANTSHTHTASQITDFSSAVDARIPPPLASTTLTYGTTTRSLNTAFRVSTTSAALVTYTVDVSATLSLTGGDTGTVTLQYADDSAFTTNVKTVQSSVNGNAGTLTVGLNLTQTSTASLTGVIPANKWVRITTANTAGTPTFTYRTQQETILPFK